MKQLKWVTFLILFALLGSMPFSTLGPKTVAQAVASTENLSTTQLGEYGCLQHEIFLGKPDMPVLFVVEEKHASLAVQAEVAQIIEGLAQTELQFLVLVEGSPPSPLELHELVDIADPVVVDAVTAAWFEEGWLSGVEVAALSNGGMLRVVGFEPPDSAERVAHREVMDQVDLYRIIIYHCVNLLKFSWEVQGTLPEEVVEAWNVVEEAKRALSLGGKRGEGISTLLEVISTGVERGLEPYQIIAQLRDEVTTNGVNFSQLYDTYDSATAAYFNAVIEAASREDVSLVTGARELWASLFTHLYEAWGIPPADRSFANDLVVLKVLIEHWFQAKRDELEARNRRDVAMVERLLQELSSRGDRTGVMVVGAGHTANLKRILEEQGISHVIITPRSLGTFTPLRELEWYDRLLGAKDFEQSPLPWFLEGVFKAEQFLYLPEGRKAFATALSLPEALKEALAGRQPVSAGAIQRIEVVSVGNSVRVKYVSESGRILEITLPRNFSLTETAIKQLNKHLLEIGDANEHLLLFPAVHVYLEPDGRSGGAFITWATQEAMHVTCIQFDLNGHTMDELLEPFEVGTLAVSFVRDHPEALLAARVIMDPIVHALRAALEELGIAPEEVCRVAVRTGSQELRALPWDTLAILAREKGIEGYARPLLFVKSALADNYDDIQVGDKEQVLATTLRHIASWGPPGKHLVVMTLPTTKEDWDVGNPFAEYLATEGRSWGGYQEEVLPYINQFLETVRSSEGAVIEPSTLEELIEKLRYNLEGVEHGVVTITLVSHRVNGAAEPMIHFKAAASAVPVSRVVQAIRNLERAGIIPSVDLRFNFIVCRGQEAASLLLSELDSPAVLTSPRPLDISTSLVFMNRLLSELQGGSAWWEAYYWAKEWFIGTVLESSPEELYQQGIRSFEVPELHSVRDFNGLC